MDEYLAIESQYSILLIETFNGEVKKSHIQYLNSQLQFYFETSNQNPPSNLNPLSENSIGSKFQSQATPNPVLLNSSSENLISLKVQNKNIQNPEVIKISNLEFSNQAITECLKLFGFMNTKLKKTTKQDEEIYNQLVAIDTSNSKSSQTNEIFPVLISISQVSITLEFFICENKRPFEVKSETCRNELMKVIENLNQKFFCLKYEIKTDKNCVILKDTIYLTQTIQEFIMVEFMKRFCCAVKTFTETSGFLYQVLKSETSNEDYKNYKTLSKLERFYINSQPSNFYTLYPFLFKKVRYCEFHFGVELNLIRIFQEIVGKCWIVIDEKNRIVYYPIYEHITRLNESNLSPKGKFEVWQFLEQLKSRNLYVLNRNLNLGVLNGDAGCMFMPKVPFLEYVKDEPFDEDDGDNGEELVEENLIEILFEVSYGLKGVKNLDQIIECVNFDRNTAMIIDDKVNLVEIRRDTEIETGVIVYGYYKTQNKLFLVVGE